MRYFDTGVLLKLYVSEPREDDAERLFKASPSPPPFTELHGLELRSALRQKEGRGEISANDCARSLGDLDADLSSGVYATPAVDWPDVFARAEALSAAHGAPTLCRSLDTLHVALAQFLGATEICTFDQRQSQMAAAAGLVIVT